MTREEFIEEIARRYHDNYLQKLPQFDEIVQRDLFNNNNFKGRIGTDWYFVTVSETTAIPLIVIHKSLTPL